MLARETAPAAVRLRRSCASCGRCVRMERNRHANRYDRPGEDGRQHGRAARQGRPRLPCVRHASGGGPRIGRQGRQGCCEPRRVRAETDQAACGLADGAGRRRRSRPGRPDRRSWSRATSSSTAAIRTTTTTSAAPRELKAKGIHYVDVGVSGGVWGLERGYCQMIGGEKEVVAASRSDLQDAGPGHRHGGPHARREPASRAGPSKAICIAARTAPGTSSRWSITASSTA